MYERMRERASDCVYVCGFQQLMLMNVSLLNTKKEQLFVLTSVYFIFLKTKFLSIRTVIPICLPVNDQMLQVLSNRFTVTGFGLTENGRDSDTLLKILVPKVPRETCQSFHRSVIQLTEGHTCYGGEGIIDSCKGLIN